VLRQIGLEGIFGAVVCAEDCSTHKPEPEIYLTAARALGVVPAQCLVYEDTDRASRGHPGPEWHAST
jgi:HAD superfamily hydrolase (TIGR01509 family)